MLLSPLVSIDAGDLELAVGNKRANRLDWRQWNIREANGVRTKTDANVDIA